MNRGPDIKKSFKIFVVNVAVLIVLSVVCLLAAEIFLRHHYCGTTYLRASPCWRKKYVALNEYGFRDDFKIRRPKGSEEYRIGVIGDSVSFGFGINDADMSFTEILEGRIRADLSRDVVLYNLSWPGWDMPQFVSFCKNRLSFFEVDMVILTYHMNDIKDLIGDFNQYHRDHERRFAWLRTASRYSYFGEWLYTQLLGLRGSRWGYQYLAQAYQSQDLWQIQRSRIYHLTDCLRSKNIELKVVIFPELGEKWQDYPLRPAHKMVRELFEREHIEVLDLLPAYEKFNNTDLWVSRQDHHPNEKAHALTAERIYRDVLMDEFSK